MINILNKTVCNKCGKESFYEDCNSNTDIKFQHGYGSCNDGNKVEFTLCDDCLDDIYATFKIQPKIDNPYDYEWGELND